MPMLDTDLINERHLVPISSRLWVIVTMDELVERQVPQYEGECLYQRFVGFRNRKSSTKPTSVFSERRVMPNRYCQRCGVELTDDPRYCPECGEEVVENHAEATSTDGNSWDWSDPYGPFRSPRRVLVALNTLGFISFLAAIGFNAIGLPITALPHPLDIALFAFWFGVIIVGLPLWGLLHVSDNVLGFLRQG